MQQQQLKVNPWRLTSQKVLSFSGWRPSRRSIDMSRHLIESHYDGVRIKLNMPNLVKKSIKIQLFEEGLELSGLRKEGIDHIRFEDTIELDTHDLVGTIKARYKDDVLEIFCPNDVHMSIQ